MAQKSHCPADASTGAASTSRWEPNCKNKPFSVFFAKQKKKKKKYSPKRRRFEEKEDKKNWSGQPAGASRPEGHGLQGSSLALHSIRPALPSLSHFLTCRPSIVHALIMDWAMGERIDMK